MNYQVTVSTANLSTCVTGNFSPSSDFKPNDMSQERNEDKIEMIFKSKRANVYTAGVSLDNRINYHPRSIKKTSLQSELIRK